MNDIRPKKDREVLQPEVARISSRLRTRYRLTAVRVPRDTRNPLSFSPATRKDIIIECRRIDRDCYQ